jgi:hypothetical protein
MKMLIPIMKSRLAIPSLVGSGFRQVDTDAKCIPGIHFSERREAAPST